MPMDFLKFKYIQFRESRTKTLHRLASAVRGVGCARRRRSFDGLPGFVQSGDNRLGPPGASIYVSSLDYSPGAGDRRIVDPLLLGAARNMVDRPRQLRLCVIDACQRHRAPEFFDLQARLDVRSLHVAAIGGRVAQPRDRNCPTHFLASISISSIGEVAGATLRIPEKRLREVLVCIVYLEKLRTIPRRSGQVVPTSFLSTNFWRCQTESGRLDPELSAVMSTVCSHSGLAAP